MILILDDHPLARQGMKSVLQIHKPEEKIVQAGTVKEAIEQMRRVPVDMALVDLNLGHENGFTFVEWLQTEGYQIKVFLITSSSRESDYLYAKQKNVDAYLLKEDFIDDILYGLKVVERGGRFYSPAISEKISSPSKDEELLQTLTGREMDVLVLLSQGYSNGKISDTLYISEGTAKRHITNILGKLGLESRTEALLFANNNRQILRIAIKRGVKEDRRRHSL